MMWSPDDSCLLSEYVCPTRRKNLINQTSLLNGKTKNTTSVHVRMPGK